MRFELLHDEPEVAHAAIDPRRNDRSLHAVEMVEVELGVVGSQKTILEARVTSC